MRLSEAVDGHGCATARRQPIITVSISQPIAALLALVLAATAFSFVSEHPSEPWTFRDDKATVAVQSAESSWHHLSEHERNAIRMNLDRFWNVASDEHLSKAELIRQAIAAKTSLPADFVNDVIAASRGAGVPFPEVLAFNLFSGEFGPTDECTVFVAAGIGSLTGDTLNSKNRDLNDSYVQVPVLVSPTNGYGYIGVSTAGQVGVAMGINEMGVSITDTSMMTPGYDENGYSTFTVMDHVLRQSANVETAISVIDTTAKRTGATYIVADKNQAAIVETVPTIYVPDISYVILRDRVAYHTNHYLLEPFRSWVVNGSFGTVHPSSYARYDRAAELVQAANGSVSATILMHFLRDLKNFGGSRWSEVVKSHPEVPRTIWAPGSSDYSIDNRHTASSAIFVSDGHEPNMLSTMWMAIGNPSFSPYVPIHNGALDDPEHITQQLELYSAGTASTLSIAFETAMSAHWGSFENHFAEFEQTAMQEVDSIEHHAEALIDSNLVAQARLALKSSDTNIALRGLEQFQLQSARIQLSANWSQVAVPLLNDTLSPSRLGLIPGSEVIEWNASTQCDGREYTVGLSNTSSDFNLGAGHSYWIFSPSAQTIELVGYSPDMIHQLEMPLIVPQGGGWADVGFETLGPGFPASIIQSMIFEANVTTVCQWNPIPEEFSFYVVGFSPSSADFVLEPGEGALVWIDGPGTLVYSP